MKVIYILLAFFLSGCAINTNKPAENIDEISISQNGKVFPFSSNIDNPVHISINAGSFLLKSPLLNDKVPVQVCATNSREAMDRLKTIKIIRKHPCFSIGTGLAMPRVADPKTGLPLFISNGSGHNYYSSGRRFSSSEDITIYVKDVKPARAAHSANTYVIVVVDKNRDNNLQDGEAWFSIIHWK